MNSMTRRTLVVLIAALLPAPPAARAQLNVVNGDFSDLTGMTQGQDGWYGGLPKGWRGSDSVYAIDARRGAMPPTCNPSTLGFSARTPAFWIKLRTSRSPLMSPSPWTTGAVLNASILDANLMQLAAGDFSAGAKQTLVARNVPAGTGIVIAFQAAKGTPGLDNVALVVRGTASATPPLADSGPRITVASYYFGNYHPGDPRNEKNKGKGWSEWELVKAAKPRFPGHHQPNVPLWGYIDESDPRAMEQKIAAAADHGIDAFIFDWYYYNDGPFLDRPIDRGFLKARNNVRLKFAFMWANHDWQELHPYRRGTQRKILYPGAVTPGELRQDLRPRHPLVLPASVLLAD